MSRFLFVAAVVAMQLLSASSLHAQAAPPDTAKPTNARSNKPVTHRIVLPINSEDASVMKQVISTALHLSMHYQSINEPASIEIVAYSAGVHMFRGDTSPVREQLMKLLQTNPTIRFVVCEATKLGMERVEGKSVPLFENVGMKPNGPAHIVNLQESGWSYIRT